MAFLSAPPRDLDPLLVEHAPRIASLKASLGKLPDYFDDIWLLRFVLSNPVPEKCLEAATHCLSWRAEHAELLADVAAGKRHAIEDVISQHFVYGMHGTSAHGEPIVIIRVGLCNFSACGTAVSPTALLDYLFAIRERNYRACDEATRARRKLVKMICVVDLAGAHLGQFDRGFASTVGASNKVADAIFPQVS
jgi:hypothetical protein